MKRRALFLLGLAAAAACDGGAGAPTGIGTGPARLRAFNAVVNADPRFGGSVDLVVDGSTLRPGAPSVAPGAASEYAAAGEGLLSFHARLTGDSRPPAQSNLLRGERRLRAAGGFDYSLYLVGVVPEAGAADVEPLAVTDDPFPPSRGPDGRPRARVRLVNAAPYAGGTPGGTLVSLYVTPGAAPPESFFELVAQSVIGYREAGGAVEVAPGTYTVTAVRTLTYGVLARRVVRLDPGAARTFVVVSDRPTAAPSPDDHRLVSLTDRDFP